MARDASESTVSSQISNSSVPHTLSSPVSNQVDPKALNPHPRNFSIYGEDEDSELIELICQSGWIKPLVITPNNIIISGHRRWKAALELGIESIPVEVREFLDEVAELEALLLENASRTKTTEQKVREGEAWSLVEKHRAKQRQQQAAVTTNQKLGRDSSKTLMENFPQASKGTTRDAIASRVGLGSGRTYEKAAKVVKTIDLLLKDTPQTAQELRKVLNERSVDAAAKLLKQISRSNDHEGASLDNVRTRTNFGKDAAYGPQRSCWNCQHRGESTDNHSFYCNRLGILSLIDKNADTRGAECSLWCDRYTTQTDALDSRRHTPKTFSLELPAHLQPLIQDAARIKGMTVVDWAAWVLESEALATCRTTTFTEFFAAEASGLHP